MKIPKEIIEKAIEGGWKGPHWDGLDLWQETVLDSTFWRALGKSLGWSFVTCKHQGKCLDGASGLHCSQWEENNCDDQEKWIYNAHHFYDLILTNQPTDKFWKELLLTKKE